MLRTSFCRDFALICRDFIALMIHSLHRYVKKI